MAEIRERKRKNGEISYTVIIRIKGNPIITKTFKRKTDAKEWANRTESEIRENINFPKRKAQKLTVSEIINKFIDLKLDKYKPKMQKEFTKALNWYKKEIGSLYLSSVTTAKLVECREKLSKKNKEVPTKNGKVITKDKTLAPATINHYMACLGTVFTYCVADLEILDINPMTKVKKVKANNARKRFLEIEEISKLLQTCLNTDYELFLCVLIAISTGARKSEILKLTWGMVDFKQKILRFSNTKNGDDRDTPISGLLYDELQTFKKQNKVHRLKNDYIFRTSDGKPKESLIGKLFPKVVNKCGITNFRFHDLRHTAASWLAMNGTSQPVLQEILGHKTPAMTSRYKHFMSEYKRPAIDKLADVAFSEYLKNKEA
jgi:integrase